MIPPIHWVNIWFFNDFFNVLDDVVSLEFSSDKATIGKLYDWVYKLIVSFFKDISVVLGVWNGGLEGEFGEFIVIGFFGEEKKLFSQKIVRVILKSLSGIELWSLGFGQFTNPSVELAFGQCFWMGDKTSFKIDDVFGLSGPERPESWYRAQLHSHFCYYYLKYYKPIIHLSFTSITF